MTFYKSLIFISFIIFCFYIFQSSNISAINNDFIQKLNFSLDSTKLKTKNSPLCFPNIGFCSLIVTYNNYETKVLINSTDDAYFQIASLQQILKTATMNHKHAVFIDLSSSRNYATLKDY